MQRGDARLSAVSQSADARRRPVRGAGLNEAVQGLADARIGLSVRTGAAGKSRVRLRWAGRMYRAGRCGCRASACQVHPCRAGLRERRFRTRIFREDLREGRLAVRGHEIDSSESGFRLRPSRRRLRESRSAARECPLGLNESGCRFREQKVHLRECGFHYRESRIGLRECRPGIRESPLRVREQAFAVPEQLVGIPEWKKYLTFVYLGLRMPRALRPCIH